MRSLAFILKEVTLLKHCQDIPSNIILRKFLGTKVCLSDSVWRRVALSQWVTCVGVFICINKTSMQKVIAMVLRILCQRGNFSDTIE